MIIMKPTNAALFASVVTLLAASAWSAAATVRSHKPGATTPSGVLAQHYAVRSPMKPIIGKNSGGAPPEFWNQRMQYPCGGSGPCPTNLEATFRGNLLAVIPSPQPLYGHFNAFCPPSRGPDNPCPPSLTYDGSRNLTTVTFGGPSSTYGDTLYQNSYTPGDVHFAFMAGSGGKPKIRRLKESSYWSYKSDPPQSLPIVSVNWAGLVSDQASTNWAYAVVYIAGTTSPSNPDMYSSWIEIPYRPSGSNQPRFDFRNYGKQPIYVVNSGIVTNLPVPNDPNCIQHPECPEDMQLIGTLNEIQFPPPGQSGSPFVPLQYPPPHVLNPHR